MGESQIRVAQKLVLEFGWNSTCYQILNPGMELWFAPSRTAVVGYVLKNGVRVVAGAPVCAEEDLAEVVGLWEEDAALNRHRVCYFGAEARLCRCLSRREGYSTVSMGAQPSWNPQDWSSIFDDDRTLRAQRSRVIHKGVSVEEWSGDRVSNSRELRNCLSEWLITRGLPPMHFMVEPETLGFVDGRRVFVAEQEGRIVGFLVLSPVPVRNGWLTEQFPRSKDAPNGTVEILMDYAIRAVALTGSTYVTMGIVPLSLNGLPSVTPNPRWLKVLLQWVRAHGKRFYNFDGLDQFKSKFRPQQWEPIYVITKERAFSYRSLHAIASAFSDKSPSSSIIRGFGRAARQEAIWIGEAAKRKLRER